MDQEAPPSFLPSSMFQEAAVGSTIEASAGERLSEVKVLLPVLLHPILSESFTSALAVSPETE